MEKNWIRPKKCPICGKDGCGVAPDGRICLCSREPSDKLIGSPFGGGWVHRIGEIGRQIIKTFKAKKPEPKKTHEEWYKLIQEYMFNMQYCDWALVQQGLGLSAIALGSYWIGRCQTGVYSFPMQTGKGKFCGIRLRAMDGSKWSVNGSQNGLFIPTVNFYRDPLIICEGCTDAPTLTAMNFDTIGRPNCSACIEEVKDFLTVHDTRKVVIMADNDMPKQRKDGSFWYPGMEGAIKLSEEIVHLCESLKIVQPPVKDVRQWYNQGGTRNDVLELTR